MMRSLFAGLGLTVMFAGPARAVIIVEDPAQLIQWGKSIENEIRSYALQFKTYIGDELSWAMQAKQYAIEGEQLYSFVHQPIMGQVMGVLNLTGLGNSLPVSPYAVMGMVGGVRYGGGGMPVINGVLNLLADQSGAAWAANHVYSPTDNTWASQQVIANGNSIAGTQGMALAAYSDLHGHEAALQAMRDRLETASTPKDVQDIQAQIALEETWTANENAKLAAIQTAYQTEVRSREQQASEQITKSLDGQIEQARAAGVMQ